MIALRPEMSLLPISGVFAKMKQRTNSEWLSALTAGNSDEAAALADLLSLMTVAISRVLSRQPVVDDAMGAHHLTEDCAQESVLLIREKLSQFRNESRFTTWAYAIGVRVALGELRRRKWQKAALDKAQLGLAAPSWPIDGPGPDRNLEQQQAWALLTELIESSLTPLQRKALIAHAFQEMPLDEVARWLGSNRNSIYKLIHDARKRLKASLSAHGVSHSELISIFDASHMERHSISDSKNLDAEDVS
jgi:RNA polymerase sigma-70 factor (ECF subfamily)